MHKKPTDEQRTIISAALNVHMKVIAVPGSGKSTTLCWRLQHLFESGAEPNRTLVLMFNKSAQLDFVGKLRDLLGGDTVMPQIRTYNALGNRLCNTFGKAQLLSHRKLVDSRGWAFKIAREVLRKVVPDSNLSLCTPDRPSVTEDFLSFCDFVKSGLDHPKDCFRRMGWVHGYLPFIVGYDRLAEYCKAEGVRFFSDQIYEPVMLLRRSEEARLLIANKLDYIIVDEYQDINPISQELIRYLAGNRATVTVVGDDDQTIYEFRGSNPSYLISGFDQHFHGAKTYTLSRTFRYGHAISLAANNIIFHNKSRVDKLCVSDSSTPASKIHIWTDDPDDSLRPSQRPIVKTVKDHIAAGGKYSEIAILTRVFSMSSPIELLFLQTDIPYRLEGADSVFANGDIQALIALLRLADGSFWSRDEEYRTLALERVLSLPHPGAGQYILKDIARRGVAGPQNFTQAIRLVSAQLPDYLRIRMHERADLLDKMCNAKSRIPEDVLAFYIEHVKCYEEITRMAGRGSEALESISVLKAFHQFCANQATDIPCILRTIDRMLDYQLKDTPAETVLLTSVHRSKGLEWPLVILPSLHEGHFPYRKEGTAVDIESERRLFYVAITRAINDLVLIAPRDQELIKSIRDCLGKPLQFISGRRQFASQFVYELNVRPCSILAAAIAGDRARMNDLPPIQHPLLMNRYQQAIDSGLALVQRL